MSIRSIMWWKYRSVELTVALCFVMAVLYLTNVVQMRQRANVPADSWFAVYDLSVPNFRQGENPNIVYDRQIKEPFLGFWVVEVSRQLEDGRYILECSGNGVNDYQPQDYIPKNSVTWEWFIGRRCDELPPGLYKIRASWTMKRTDWPSKTVVIYSNAFKIEPR